MFKFIVASALLACALALPYPFRKYAGVPLLDGRIVGGEEVQIENYPFSLSLRYFSSHICGASIIGAQYGVTAAHCTDGSSAAQLSVRAGSSNRLDGGVVVNINTIYQHPNYDDWLIDYDISVLRFSDPLTFGSTTAAIGLPVQSQPIPVGVESRVSGWGYLTEGGGSLPVNLQAVTVLTVSLEDCRAAYGASLVTERMMCAGVPGGGKDACQGDSGGPLVIGQQLIGLVSWGYGCARADYPGVYASVPELRNFIAQSVGI